MFVATLCFGQRYNLFRIIAQNNSIQHTTIRSALERLVPSCPVVGFGRPYLVDVVHGAIIESGCVLEAVCRSPGYLFGRLCRHVSGSSLYLLRTKHTPACFALLASCCRVTIRAVCVWFCENELEGDIAPFQSCAHVPFDHKHEIHFLPSVLSVVVDGPPTTDATGEQDICPCPYLRTLFTFAFYLSERKVKLCICLYQLCTHIRQQKEQSRPIQLPRKQ